MILNPKTRIEFWGYNETAIKFRPILVMIHPYPFKANRIKNLEEYPYSSLGFESQFIRKSLLYKTYLFSHLSSG